MAYESLCYVGGFMWLPLALKFFWSNFDWFDISFHTESVKPNMSVKEQIIIWTGHGEKKNTKTDFLKLDPSHYCRWFEIKISKGKDID